MKILPKTRKIVKTIYIKLDDFREEKLEDFLSNDILKRWDEFKNVDDLRRSINLAIINAVGAYASSQGLPALSNDVKQKIADEAVKIEKKLNKKLQAQLNKKSKTYLERHKGETGND